MLENGLIQIAGVMDQAEAELLQQCGIKYLGFPLHLPVHRADLTEQQAAEIIQRLPPRFSGCSLPISMALAVSLIAAAPLA